MKSYEEYKLEVLTEGVNPQDAQAWKNFIRAAEELQRVLSTPDMTLHALILNDIDHRMADVCVHLNRLDRVLQWKDEIRKRGGQLVGD